MQRKTIDFESACQALGRPTTRPDFSFLPETEAKEEIENYETKVIALSINKENDDWKADKTNPNQIKYEPVFCFVPGVGWRDFGFAGWGARATVGSRLFGTSNDAKYFAELIIEKGYKI